MSNDQRESSTEHHFQTAEQQREAATLGMWVFLATEVLFFGGLFMSYTFLRWSNGAAVEASSRHLELVTGSINTAVLLTSSFLMASGVHYVEGGRPRMGALMLAITAVMGVAFLAIKGTEYSHAIGEGFFPGAGFRAHHGRIGAPGAVELFFWLYFMMTGLHALHVLIGIVLLSTIAIMLRRRVVTVSPNTVHNAGLYWHFVDLVWVFLFPLLYLAGHW